MKQFRPYDPMLIEIASAFLHGQGGELQHMAAWTGNMQLPDDPFPSALAFELAVTSLYELFRVTIQHTAALVGLDLDTPPVSYAFRQWRQGVYAQPHTTGHG